MMPLKRRIEDTLKKDITSIFTFFQYIHMYACLYIQMYVCCVLCFLLPIIVTF